MDAAEPALHCARSWQRLSWNCLRDGDGDGVGVGVGDADEIAVWDRWLRFVLLRDMIIIFYIYIFLTVSVCLFNCLCPSPSLSAACPLEQGSAWRLCVLPAPFFLGRKITTAITIAKITFLHNQSTCQLSVKHRNNNNNNKKGKLQQHLLR